MGQCEYNQNAQQIHHSHPREPVGVIPITRGTASSASLRNLAGNVIQQPATGLGHQYVGYSQYNNSYPDLYNHGNPHHFAAYASGYPPGYATGYTGYPQNPNFQYIHQYQQEYQHFDFGVQRTSYNYVSQTNQQHSHRPNESPGPKRWTRASSSSYKQHYQVPNEQNAPQMRPVVAETVTSTNSVISSVSQSETAFKPMAQAPNATSIEVIHEMNNLSLSNNTPTATVNENNPALSDRGARIARLYGQVSSDPNSEDPAMRSRGGMGAGSRSTLQYNKTSLSQSALNLSNHAVRNPKQQNQLNIAIPKAADAEFKAMASEPATPLAPPPVASIDMLGGSPRRGTPSRLARIFGVKSKGEETVESVIQFASSGNDNANSRVSSPASSRNTPSLASRISSRISSLNSSLSGSRIGSRMGSSLSGKDSRVGPYGNSLAASSTTSLLELSAHGEPKELTNEWMRFTPRRDPNDVVKNDFVKFGSPTIPLFDIDSIFENNLPSSVNPLNQEMRQFLNRGVYYNGEECDSVGGADGDGNYKSVKGEQIGYRYNVVDELGRGSFGTVLRCRDHRTGRMVAVKVTANRQEIQGQARIEARMLRALLVDHKGDPGKHHFLRYIEHFTFKGHLCIATELLGPNLFEMAKRNLFRGLKEPTVQYITRQILEGLEFLVDQHIIHCDLKPENILVSDHELCQVKIVDFGSGCYERSRVYTYIQSRFYRSPEILLGMPYGPPIDMWSLGSIVSELLIGRPLFQSVDETDQVTLICAVIGSPDPQVMWKCRRAPLFFNTAGMPLQLTNSKGEQRGMPGSTPLQDIMSHCSSDSVDFCSQLLQWAPEKRLTAAKAIYHPFVISQ